MKEGNEGLGREAGRADADSRSIVSPLSLLKNPMILIAVVGLAFVVGMPYLLDNSTFRIFSLFDWRFYAHEGDGETDTRIAVDPEMKAEFEEQQKKSVLTGGASAANPLQNFDMAAWMAGKTTGGTASGSGRENEGEKAGGNKKRRG